MVEVFGHWVRVWPGQSSVLEKDQQIIGEKENIDQIEQKKLLGVPNDFDVGLKEL